MKTRFMMLIAFSVLTGCSTPGHLVSGAKGLERFEKENRAKYAPRDIGAVQSVNPNATPETQAVLTYLAEISKRNVPGFIIGQNCGHGSEISRYDDNNINSYNRLVRDLYGKTGKWVGLIGIDYGCHDNYTPGDLEAGNKVLIDYWNKGGLVQITWTAVSPFNTVNGIPAVVDLELLLDPSSEYYNIWRSYLNNVAGGLQQLEDAGVVVLFRPMQEMNGSWMWYGQQTNNLRPDLYIAIWRDMFNYFTYEKKLDNLLWVYSPASALDDQYRSVAPITSCYPGDDYVDIVAGTQYTMNYSVVAYSTYQSLGKPIGAGEFGHAHSRFSSNRGIHDLMTASEHMNSDYPGVSYICFWHSWLENGQNNHFALVDNARAREFMNDPLTITRDKIAWRDYLKK
jgi:mannan endo-1,4-beta-mannosidase